MTKPNLGITRATHMLMHVRDVEQSLRFYTDVLGFTVRENGFMPDGREYQSTNEGLGIVAYPAGETPGHTFDHFAFRCPNGIDTVIKHLESLGIEHEPTKRTAWGLSVYFRDPDGNRIECHDSTGYDGTPQPTA